MNIYVDTYTVTILREDDFFGDETICEVGTFIRVTDAIDCYKATTKSKVQEIIKEKDAEDVEDGRKNWHSWYRVLLDRQGEKSWDYEELLEKTYRF